MKRSPVRRRLAVSRASGRPRRHATRARCALATAQDDLTSTIVGGEFRPNDVEILQNWLGNAGRRQVELEERLDDEEAAFEEIRERMIERRRELLALEKARERAWDRWREEATRDEQAAAEEVAITRHERRRRMEG